MSPAKVQRFIEMAKEKPKKFSEYTKGTVLFVYLAAHRDVVGKLSLVVIVVLKYE